MWALDRLFALCASLRMAVITILSLATLLGIATFYEARYGAAAVQELIYGSKVFLAVMAALAINVMAAAMIRYPWKRKQTGFVITHLGILILLGGCLLSFRTSVDGRIALRPGDSVKDMILAGERLQIAVAGKTYTFPVQFWREAGYPTAFEALTFRWPEPRWRSEPVVYDPEPGVRLELLEWLPAAKLVRELRDDPAGTPQVELELAGTTPAGMAVDQKLTLGIPKGEAGVTQQIFGNVLEAALWTTTSAGDVADFLAPPKPETLGERGTLTLRVGENAVTVPVGKEGETTALPGGGSATILQYLPQASAEGAKLVAAGTEAVSPVVRVRIVDPTATNREFVASARNPYLVLQSAGPALAEMTVRFDHPAMYGRIADGTRGRLHLLQGPGGKLYFRAYAIEGVRSSGEVKVGVEVAKWMGFNAVVHRHLAKGTLVEEYARANVAPNKLLEAMRAARVALTVDGVRREAWIARASAAKGVSTPRGIATLAYGFEAADLPFSVALLDAKRTNNPGTTEAATFESSVIVTKPGGEKQRTVITMNEPLTTGGFTFYQAGFDDGLGTPVTTLAVRKDPGTWPKYAGSLIICVGIFLMFYMKAYFAKPAALPSPAVESEQRELVGGGI